MRELIYALLYLTCAAVLTAFPVFLYFVLFGEQEEISRSERMTASVNTTVHAKTPAPAETPAHEDTEPRPQPAWIVPTPKYNYQRPSSASTGVDALQAFAAEADDESAPRERPTRKISSRNESRLITSPSEPSSDRGTYREIDRPAVFDTAPLAPD